MKKRVLIIISGFYPYQKSEDYLSNEINYIKGFDKVILFSSLIYGLKSTKDIDGYPQPPQNIEIRNSCHNFKASILKKIYYAITHKYIYEEFFYIFKNNKYIVRKIRTMIRTYLQSVTAYYDLKHIIRNELYDKDTDIFIYSYWMSGTALTASMLKEDNLNIKKIFSRCHRFDVYEYANTIKYISFRKYILSRLDIIFSISDDAKRYLENKYGALVKGKIEISRLGTFDNGVHIIPKPNCIRILSCSWLRPVKRVDLIFEALDNMDISAEWTHYGDGEEMKRITDLIKKKKNKNLIVNFPGAKKNIEVLESYKKDSFDVFVNVSKNEGVPVSIMEAMSFGKVIIATNVGGTAEIVENNKNGFLLEENFDITDLQNAFKGLCLLDTQVFASMCRNSRNIWENLSNADTNYKNFYNRLAEL